MYTSKEKVTVEICNTLKWTDLIHYPVIKIKKERKIIEIYKMIDINHDVKKVAVVEKGVIKDVYSDRKV